MGTHPRERVRTLVVTTPINTPLAAPLSTTWDMGVGVLERLDIVIPPGHAGLTGFQLLWGGRQVVPYEGSEWLVGNDDEITVELGLWTGAGRLVVRTYNTDGFFPHGHYLRAYITELERAPVLAPLTFPVLPAGEVPVLPEIPPAEELPPPEELPPDVELEELLMPLADEILASLEQIRSVLADQVSPSLDELNATLTDLYNYTVGDVTDALNGIPDQIGAEGDAIVAAVQEALHQATGRIVTVVKKRTARKPVKPKAKKPAPVRRAPARQR